MTASSSPSVLKISYTLRFARLKTTRGRRALINESMPFGKNGSGREMREIISHSARIHLRGMSKCFMGRKSIGIRNEIDFFFSENSILFLKDVFLDTNRTICLFGRVRLSVWRGSV